MRIFLRFFLCCLFLAPLLPVSASPVIIGGDMDYPPFEFINERGEADGFNTDVLKAVARVMKMELKFDFRQWSTVRRMFEEGEVDALAGMLKTPSREERYDFSIPYFPMSYTVFVPEGSSIRRKEDLGQAIIIVQESDAAHEYAIEHQLGRELILVPSHSVGLQQLEKGIGDCIIMSRLQGFLIIRELGIEGIKAAGEPLFQFNYGLAVDKGNSDLLYLFNEGLSILKASGEFDTIYTSWFDAAPDHQIRFTDILIYLALIVIPLGLIIMAVLLWSWSLRRQITKQTASLARELSERKEAERALHANRETLFMIINLVPHMIYLVDRKGKFLMVNRAAADAFGVSPESLVGTHYRSLPVPPEELRQYRIAAGKLIRDHELQNIPRHQFTDLEGQKHWMHTVMVPYDHSIDKRSYILGISMDTTQLMRMEEQLQQAQKLEAVGQLAGGIAHDFNNQLTGILGFGEMLASELSEGIHREYAQYILEAASNAAALTRQMLSFARKGFYRAEYISLHDTITQVCSILHHTIDKKIIIRKEFNARKDTLFGDFSHVQNMLLNIAVNARDAMPQGGEIIFSTRDADKDQDGNPGDFISLTVSDTGIGMDEDVLGHIFEPFFTTKEVGKGTGMGLASVYGTVQQIGGTISAASSPGKGSVFTIVIPLVDDQDIIAEASRESASDETPKQHGTILVIDDEQIFLKAAGTILVGMGYRVHLYKDPLEAIQYFHHHWMEIDAVLLDMMMPKLSGPEAFLALKRIDSRSTIIITSGYSAESEVGQVLEQGADGFIQKPFHKKDLQKLLARLLPDSERISP